MSYELKAPLGLNRGKTYSLKRIKDLSEKERPREKLLNKGVSSLSLVELLTIVLGTGTRKEEVHSMSFRLLKEYGEKAIAFQKDPKKIINDLKIPKTKACQIVACFELGRRLFTKAPGGLISIKNSKQAFRHLKDMGLLRKEQFRGLYLNNHYQLIYDEIISIGTVDSSMVHAREVFRPALERSASAIILAHNHPSGVLKSSKEDLEINSNLLKAGKILGIEILDHLIITQGGYLSII